MIEFGLIALCMLALCLALVVAPMWRNSQPAPDRRRAANIELYRQRCAELDYEVALGRLSPSARVAECDALGARLLAAVDDPPAWTMPGALSGASTGRGPWLASVLAVGLVVGMAGAGYYAFGNPSALGKANMPNINQLTAALEQAVTIHPNDRAARLMLAQMQESRGDYRAAADHLARINRAAGQLDVRLLSTEADMRLAAGEDLSARAGTLYRQILALDAHNIDALWYLGLRAAGAGQPRRAIAYWNRLLDQDLPPEPRRTVSSRRNMLRNRPPAASTRQGPQP